jgi:hypothetical protein
LNFLSHTISKRKFPLGEEAKIFSFIAKIFEERIDIFFMSGRGWDVRKAVSPEVFLGDTISHPERILLTRKTEGVHQLPMGLLR